MVIPAKFENWPIRRSTAYEREAWRMRYAPRFVISCAFVATQIFGTGVSAVGRAGDIRTIDAIQMTRIADPGHYTNSPLEGELAHFSPDGSKFVVVTRRGDLERDVNIYSLMLWESADLDRGAPPEVLLEMSSSSNRDAISNTSVTWDAGGEIIYFLGEHPGETQQLYGFNVRTRRLDRIYSHPTSMHAFSLSSGHLAFTAEPEPRSIWDDQSRRAGIVIDNQLLLDLLVGRAGTQFRGSEDERETFVRESGTTRRVNLNGLQTRYTPLSISPTGRHLVVATRVPVAEIPVEWRGYENPTLRRQLDYTAVQPRFENSGASWLFRYEVADLATGSSRVLLNSPLDPASIPISRPVWAPDGRSVILSQVFLPVESADPAFAAENTQSPATVEVDVATSAVNRVDPNCFRATTWDPVMGTLRCQAGGDMSSQNTHGSRSLTSAFAKRQGVWTRITIEPDQASWQIRLDESMSRPPRLVAFRAGRERTLLNLNPQFSHLRFGNVAEIEIPIAAAYPEVSDWARGRLIRAGLYFPPGYRPDRRYPLIIQTHSWRADRFWIDGPWSTAYAAQPLAARGFLVLQINDQYIPRPYGENGQLRDVQRAISVYRSAIDFLRGRSLVDETRVGVLGFSHNCFYIKWALVHEPELFAAASITEGPDGGYLQYITQSEPSLDIESLYGGRPYGDHLESWRALAPGFHAANVRVPLRINTLNPRYLLADWEWFTAMRENGAPVELVMLSDGHHFLQKPSERYVSLEGNVDWFDYWLNNHVDEDPSKTEQYARWGALRASVTR